MRRLVLAVALLACAAAPAQAADGEWLAGDLHVHTTYSHDSYGGPADDNTGPEEFYTLGWSVAEQFLHAVDARPRLPRDHRPQRHPLAADPGFGANGVIPLPGYENSLERPRPDARRDEALRQRRQVGRRGAGRGGRAARATAASSR